MPTAIDAGLPVVLILCCCSTAGKRSSVMSKKHIHGICPLLPGVSPHCAATAATTATCTHVVHPTTFAQGRVVILFTKQTLHTVTANGIG